MYRAVYGVLFRRLPPEAAHAAGFWLIRAATAVPGVAWVLRRFLAPRDPVLRVRALGLDFPGPLGLAAGFDKDGHGVAGLAALGFGFVEVGTVTARPQPGNAKPRMFRFPAERALVNRMGFNNAGAAALAARLRALRGARGAAARRRRQHRQDQGGARRRGDRRLRDQRPPGRGRRRLRGRQRQLPQHAWPARPASGGQAEATAWRGALGAGRGVPEAPGAAAGEDRPGPGRR